MRTLSSTAAGIFSIVILMFLLYCQKDIAGSVTETGNVSGKVYSKEDDRIVAGARISFFKQRSTISSADESYEPIQETYTDKDGYFSTFMDNGAYTIIASGKGEYAFVGDIIPGSEDARDMNVLLEHPGSLKGEIINTLELRGTGSVVTHLIGTDIYQNVDNDGRIFIENIPSGTYTMVSYSTYQEEFSPYYQKVTIYPDSTTNLGSIELSYNGIPIPKDINLAYDTLHHIVTISWDPIDEYNDFQEYAIFRGIGRLNTHKLEQIAYTKDTVYEDNILFPDSGYYTDSIPYDYVVKVTDKLGQTGQYYGVYEITAVNYDALLPKIDAGEDLHVELNSDITLEGTIAGSYWPVKKQEWKVTDGDWEEYDEGTVEFKTSSHFSSETTFCFFRVTDSIGNMVEDTVTIYQAPVVVSYGKMPGIQLGNFYSNYCIYHNNAAWTFGLVRKDRYAIWKTEDYKSWVMINDSLECNDSYIPIHFMNRMFLLSFKDSIGAYFSDDGIDWTAKEFSFDSELVDNFNKTDVAIRGITTIHDTIVVYGLINDEFMFIFSTDGISWMKHPSLHPNDDDNSYCRLSVINDSLFALFDDKKAYVRSSDGTAWEDIPLWDVNYYEKHDNAEYVFGFDTGIVAFFSEYNSNDDITYDKMAVFTNGTWYIVPSFINLGDMNERINGFTGIQRPRSVWTNENMVFWVDKDRILHSVRLY